MTDPKDGPPTIKPDHRRFITEYLTNGNNGVKAMLVTRPHIQSDSASVSASRLLANAKIRSNMEQIAIELGLDDRFRLRKLQEALGNHTISSEQVRYDAKGEVIERVAWKRDRTPSETAKIVDVLNKSTGVYELNRAAGNALSSQFKELARRYRPKLSTRGRPIKAVETPLEDVYQSIQCVLMGGIAVVDELDTQEQAS